MRIFAISATYFIVIHFFPFRYSTIIEDGFYLKIRFLWNNPVSEYSIKWVVLFQEKTSVEAGNCNELVN